MSRFTKKFVRKLAADTSQILSNEKNAAKRGATLIGKEEHLQTALLSAKCEYDSALQLEAMRDQQRKLLSNVLKDCRALDSNIARAQKCWDKMRKYGGQLEVARFVPGWETAEDIQNLVTRFDETMSLMRAATVRYRSDEQFSWRTGRPRRGKSGVSLFALAEAATVIRVFWIQQVSSTFNFGLHEVFDARTHEDKGRKVPNAATHLLWRAAQVIDKRCSLSDVRQTMESIRNKRSLLG